MVLSTKNLVSRSKKATENFIRAKLRRIPAGNSLSESSKNCSACERSKHSYPGLCTLNDVHSDVDTIHIDTYKASDGSWVIRAPYKIKEEGYLLRSYLVDTRRRLLFTVDQVFLPTGRWVDAWCRYAMHSRGKRGGQRAEKIIYVQIFLDSLENTDLYFISVQS